MEKARFTLTFAIYQGDALVDRRAITENIIKVGKDQKSHLRVDDELAARMHAVIEVSLQNPDDVTLIDLGNEPGTMVNGQRVNKCKIRPGDQIRIQSSAFNELARQTKDYRIVAMIEPGGSLKDNIGDHSPLKWPAGITRTSGEEGPYIAWGEELELPVSEADGTPLYELDVAIADALQSGAANQSLRLELTAYEDVTQVDSTSLDLQILHDPFELQNPFPNHELLKRISQVSGGKVLSTPQDLAEILNAVPAKMGVPVITRGQGAGGTCARRSGRARPGPSARPDDAGPGRRCGGHCGRG